MNFRAWLEQERGRVRAAALHFGVTQSAISQWATNGVPAARMKAVRDFTERQVTLEEMLPDPDVAAPADREAA